VQLCETDNAQLMAVEPSFADEADAKYPTGRVTRTFAPETKSVAVVKPKVRVPVVVVPGTLSPSTEKTAG